MIQNRFSVTPSILMRSVRSGENRNSLCLLTQKQGLVWAHLRRNLKKTASWPFGNIPAKFHVSFYRTTGNNFYIREASEIDPYRDIHRDFCKLKTSWHVLSPLVKIVQPGSSDEHLFKLTDRVFRAICESENEISSLLLLPPYYYSLIRHFGLGFDLEKCKFCNSNNIRGISPSEGGPVCFACSKKAPDVLDIDTALLKKTMSRPQRNYLKDQIEKKTVIALVKNLEIYLFNQFSKKTPEIFL
ncbi:DNA repair protein RecO C-terminal domain-containing protein [candidate division WOR-3 bacterium]|nr:DNA repair protein RecO C-terminal domain-containing protein [candidate division WOR-3 bacterium]